MNVKDKITSNYPLTKKVDCELDCYQLSKRVYLVFWQDLVSKEHIELILSQVQEKTSNSNFSDWKTLIIVGNTKDEFTKEDLLYFNNVSTFVVFYLINEEENKIFMDDSWIFALGCNYRKHVRKINSIIGQ